jgi:hypothetical protein
MVSVSAAAIEFACLHLGSVVAGFRRRAAHSSAVQETAVHAVNRVDAGGARQRHRAVDAHRRTSVRTRPNDARNCVEIV